MPAETRMWEEELGGGSWGRGEEGGFIGTNLPRARPPVASLACWSLKPPFLLISATDPSLLSTGCSLSPRGGVSQVHSPQEGWAQSPSSHSQTLEVLFICLSFRNSLKHRRNGKETGSQGSRFLEGPEGLLKRLLQGQLLVGVHSCASVMGRLT